jgi:hypothetical protein
MQKDDKLSFNCMNKFYVLAWEEQWKFNFILKETLCI